MSERRYTDRQIYRRVLREARPYWGHIVAIFLITLLATPLALLQPVALKVAVDNVIGGKPLPGWLDAVVPRVLQGSSSGLLVFAVLLLVCVELLSQLQSLSKTLLRTYTSEQLTLRFRARLFRHAQRLALTYHDRQGTADANYRIQSDAAAVPAVAVDGVMPFVAAGCLFAAMVYVIARIEPALAAIALVVAPILAALTWAYRRRLRVRHREVKSLESSALSVVQEALTSLRVVKAFGQEEREERRFESQAWRGMRARVRVAVVDKLFWIAIGFVTATGAAAVLFVGVRSVESGAITLGSLLLVMAYLSQLYVPLYTMTTQVGALQSGFASAERVYTFLDQEHDVPERPDARPLVRAKGAVDFRDVTFAYNGAGPVLDGVSFSIAPSTRVGIAGRTGAGKTTLVSLLTRLYDPTGGAILLDGVDLRDYRLGDVRNQFAIVLQEPVLFSTTIRENIAYGRPTAKVVDIVAAAKAADVHDFIMSLPERYDTPVGERGMTLSGGERQRIALARAFLKDAPILILDEPTSSVDTKTEAAIMDAMERLMEGRTAFMIAHRLSTLEACDLRLELRDGHVVEASETIAVAEIADHSSNGGRPGVRSARARAPSRPVRHLQLLPAVQAWEQVSGGPSAFTSVEVLKESKGSQVFRLRGGSSDLDVVAKRAPRETLESERTVYERLLAELPVRPVRYFGHLRESEDGFAWLFIEYVEAEPLRLTDQRHLVALADYLATVHGGAASLPELDSLPDRNLSFFREQIDAASALIRTGFENETIGRSGREVLMAHLELLETARSRWDAIVAGVEGLPRTLVHCDVESRNTGVVAGNGDARLVLYDWEQCGVGCTAPDLVGLARYPSILRRYADALRFQTTDISVADVERLATVGAVCRLILALTWAGASLPYPHPHRQLRYLAGYREPLATALRRVRVTASPEPAGGGREEAVATPRPRADRGGRRSQPIAQAQASAGRKGDARVPSLDILEAGLRSVLACRDGITPVVKERERNTYTSQFATELVTVGLGESELVLFCKHGEDFTDRLTGLRRGVRYETSFYNIVLRALTVDTPRFYGGFAGAHGRTLVLEYLRGASRIHHSYAAKTAIVDAAARLGAMHARGEALVGLTWLSFLSRYDREHLRAWPHRVESLIRIPAFSELLRPLADGAAQITGVLAAAQQTVIHGELYPSNVLVEADRIAFVDWETAGVGPGEIDLATLTVGDWGEEVGRRCIVAYVDSRWPSGPPPEFETVLAAARLHALMMLAAHWKGDSHRLASENWLAQQIAEATSALGIR